MTMTPTLEQIANAPAIGHFYAPIPGLNNKVLKYHGMATEFNKVWMEELHIGCIILNNYLGDRIMAETHKAV